MEWWDGIIETGGEIIGGAVDMVGEYTPNWVVDKLGLDEDKADSSNPDAQRKHQNTGENRDGDALPVGGYRPITLSPVMMLGGVILLCGVVYIAAKGK